MIVGTFAYLTACSVRNRIRVRLRRLREPRYLVGSVVGGAYFFYFVFYRIFIATGTGRSKLPSAPAALAKFLGPLQFVGSLGLLALAALTWVLPGSRKPIEFSQAEVQFLFQAPVTRRQLLHYKLMRSQLGLIFGSAVATLIMRPSTLTGRWTMLVGIWLILTLGRLYTIAVSLSRESLARHGASGIARQWAPLAVVTGAIGILVVTLGLDWSQLATASDAREFFLEVQRVLEAGVAGAVLWPFHLLVRLPMAASATQFLTVLPATLTMIALAYIWVLRSDTAFQEASAAQAEKKAASRATRRAPSVKTMATPFSLGPTGRPEAAIIWKNLIMVGRYVSFKTLIRLAPIVIVLAISAGRAGRGGIASLAAMLCMVMSLGAIFFGPQIARNDLRQDLENLAVLKTWPIRGPALVRGEILAPAAILTAVVWLVLVGAGFLAESLPMKGSAVGTIMLNRLSYTIAAMIVAPAIILAQLVVHNGAAVMFPAWVTVSASRARGIDAMGQRLLMVFAIAIVLIVVVLPAALVGGGVALVAYLTTGVFLTTLPAVLVTAVMLLECWLATEWIGRVFDRTDVGAIGPAD